MAALPLADRRSVVLTSGLGGDKVDTTLPLQIVADIAESLCFYGLGFKIVEEIVIITLDRVVGA